MNTPPGTYDHLEENDPIKFTLSVDLLVKLIHERNYGFHRVMSAIIRYRRNRYAKHGNAKDRLVADAIEKMLNDGLF